MEQAVYIDVYFMTNLIYDFLTLYLCGKLMHRPLVMWRIIASAAFGSLWACIALVFMTEITASAPARILVMLIMIFIAYRQTDLLSFAKNACAFLAISFGTAGGIFALGFALGYERGVILDNGYFYFDFPYLTLAFFWAVSAVIYEAAFKILRIVKSVKHAEVLIYQGGKCCKVKCLVDTGNLLKEPIFGRYIIVCLFDRIRRVLDDETALKITENVEKCPAEILLNLNNSPQPLRFSVSPCRTLGNRQADLLTYRPDKIFINGAERCDAVLGLSFSPLDKDFEGLISNELLI